MKLLHVQKRDNIEFYLCCKFQRLPFSVRHKTDVTDGVDRLKLFLEDVYAPPELSCSLDGTDLQLLA